MSNRTIRFFIHFNNSINNAPYEVHFLFMKGDNPE